MTYHWTVRCKLVNESISLPNTRVCTTHRGIIWEGGVRYLRNSTQLSLIARINRPRRIPWKLPPRRLSPREYGRVSVSWHSSRERTRFLHAVCLPAFSRPAFVLPYAGWKYLFAIRSATLSRHGNGKRYSSCFRDTLTENTRVSSTYILSREAGEGGERGSLCGCATAMSDWGWPET